MVDSEGTEIGSSGLSRRGLLKGAAGASLLVGGGALLAACSDEEADPAAATTAATTGGDAAPSADVDLSGLEPDKTIGVVGYVLTSETPGRGKTELERIAGETGWDIQFVDANGDATKIPTFVQDFVTKGVDAIFTWVFPGALLGESGAAAIEAGIPLIGVFSGEGEGITARVEPSEWISASRIGEYVTQRMGFAGEVAILNWEQIPPLVVRGAVAREMLGYYPNITIVEDIVLKVPGQVEDSKAQTASILAKHPDLKAIWAGWDEVGVAASQAVVDAGREGQVFVVGIDGNLSSFDAIRNDEPFAATCYNDIELMARLAVKQADELFKGNTVPPVTIVDSPFVSSTNVPAQGQVPSGTLTPFWVP